MQPDAHALRLARGLLETSAIELEKQADAGRYNTMSIRALAQAATVLRMMDVADRAIRLLQMAPDEAFWGGMITNLELPKTVPDRLRTVDPPDKLEKYYPLFNQTDMLKRIQSYAETEEHLALCLTGHIQEARSMAQSGRLLQEVGDTLAILGEFDAALSVARDPALDRFRQNGVLYIVMIELFRRGRFKEAEAILSDLGAGEGIQLALGIAGREPWAGYPYPDW